MSKVLIGNIKGVPGEPGKNGENATITGASVTVDDGVGTPSASVTLGGTEAERTFEFAFKNLRGEKGDKGDAGEKGDVGEKGEKGDRGEKGDSYILTDADKSSIASAVRTAMKSESWTFTLEDGSTVVKAVYVG